MVHRLHAITVCHALHHVFHWSTIDISGIELKKLLETIVAKIYNRMYLNKQVTGYVQH
jgi:hypothetical protein